LRVEAPSARSERLFAYTGLSRWTRGFRSFGKPCMGA